MKNEREAPGYLSEVFISHQGEGSWVGRRQLFIRLAGCRQRCRYCDTRWSRVQRPSDWFFRPGKGPCHRLPNPVIVSDLLPRLERLLAARGPVHSIAVTGGEPTEQPKFLGRLITGLKQNLQHNLILLETNGLEDIYDKVLIAGVDFISLDIKLPSATGQRRLLGKYRRVMGFYPQKHGCVKLVFSTKTTLREIERAAALAGSLKPEWDLILQPVTGVSWRAPRLAAKLDAFSKAALARHPRARLIPQVHPVLGIR